MTDNITDNEIVQIHTRLDKQSNDMDKVFDKLDEIKDTLATIAVQSERLDGHEKEIRALWKKYDEHFSPDGTVPRISNHQASCPRGQVKLMWWIVLPMGLALLSAAIRMWIS